MVAAVSKPYQKSLRFYPSATLNSSLNSSLPVALNTKKKKKKGRKKKVGELFPKEKQGYTNINWQ